MSITLEFRKKRIYWNFKLFVEIENKSGTKISANKTSDLKVNWFCCIVLSKGRESFKVYFQVGFVIYRWEGSKDS